MMAGKLSLAPQSNKGIFTSGQTANTEMRLETRMDIRDIELIASYQSPVAPETKRANMAANKAATAANTPAFDIPSW